MAMPLGVSTAATLMLLAPIMSRVDGAGDARVEIRQLTSVDTHIAHHSPKSPSSSLLSLWPIPRIVDTSSCGGPVPLSPDFAVVGPHVPRIARALERLQLPPGPPGLPMSLKELLITLRTPDNGAVPSKTEDES